MRRSAIRLLMLATFSATLVAAPVVSTVYAAPDSDAPAPSTPPKTKAKKKSSEVSPSREYAAFAHAAYATIYDRHDSPPRSSS
jgi:hypothetical protein